MPMASNLSAMGLYLGYRIGISVITKEMYLNPKLVRLKQQNFGYSAMYLSSASTDSSLKEKPTYKKKPSILSTNIIHVGEEAVSHTDTKVKRLKPSQLHKVDNPFVNTNTSEEKSESLKYSCEQTEETKTNIGEVKDGNNLKIVPYYEEPTEGKNLNLEQLQLTSIRTSSSEANRKKKSVENIKDLKHNRILEMFEQMRIAGRNHNFNDTLASFISVCMHTGNSNSAFQTFNYFLKREKKKPSKYSKCLTLSPFNELLKGIAVQGNYKKMKEIRNLLKKSSLTPDHNTFAYILTCLGHLDNFPHIISDIESTLQWMEECNVNIEEMFKSALFPDDSIQFCMKAIESVDPDIKERLQFFNPSLETLAMENSYDNSLVNELNESLFSKKHMSPAEGVLTSEELSSLIKNQIDEELKGFIHVPSIIKGDSSELVKRNRDLLERWDSHWRDCLYKTLLIQKDFMSRNFLTRDHTGIDFYPYFSVLDIDDIVNLLMLEVYKLSMGSDYYSPSINYLARELGNEFYGRFLIKYKEKTRNLSLLEDVYRKYCFWYLNRSVGDSYIPRIHWNKLLSEKIENVSLRDHPPEWPFTVKTSIGKMLYNIIFSTVVVWNENQSPENPSPAFYKVHRKYNLKLRDEVKPSPILLDVFRGASQRSLIFPSGSLPMLSPAIPWNSLRSGGYFVSKSDLVRMVQHAHQQKNRMTEGGLKKLSPVLDSLNQLASIPWKINHSILDILIEVFNKKGWEKMDVAPPSSEIPVPASISENMSPEEKVELKRAHSMYKKKKREMYSLWCSMLYKLSIANYYRDNTIWLPQNLDFRGRTYPIPPHLTHLSSDVFRAIMLFAQGKKLGKDGLFWLKLHIVNLTGMKKKESIQSRLNFCEEMMEEIFDSADNPLNGRRWWIDSDEPWQTLAACKELVAALRSESPEDFESHLPIHQDGSCNGLQHYAALGRDKAGATSVNLRSSEKPKDVYSDIVNLVEKERQTDANEGLEIAEVLEGFVKRKVIKQTVMTTVYGVTRYGAKLQILKQLNYLEEFPEKHRFNGSNYLTAKTFQSLGTIFTATKEIQDWLVKVAEGVAKCCLKNVEWVTPLGFPVVQPYSKNINSNIVPGKIFSTFNCDLFLKPNLIKQKNAFPPNFIHSLDSSHMMLTSLFSQHVGITFVSIHDCFWTHASTVPVMNEICREQFVKLHKQPILEDLAKYLDEICSSHDSYHIPYTMYRSREVSLCSLLKNIPKKGDFDINEVKKSIFFFS